MYRWRFVQTFVWNVYDELCWKKELLSDQSAMETGIAPNGISTYWLLVGAT